MFSISFSGVSINFFGFKGLSNRQQGKACNDMAYSRRTVYFVPYKLSKILQTCGIKIGDKLAPVTVKLIASVRRFLKYVFVAMYRAGIKMPWPIPKMF